MLTFIIVKKYSYITFQQLLYILFSLNIFTQILCIYSKHLNFTGYKFEQRIIIIYIKQIK